MRRLFSGLLLLLLPSAHPAEAVELAWGDLLVVGSSYAGPGTGDCDGLCRVDPATGAATPIAALPAIAFSGEGSVDLAVESASSVLVLLAESPTLASPPLLRVDPTTGDVTTLNPGIAGARDLEVDPEGRIFVVDGSGIVEVDPGDGGLTPILPGTYRGLTVDPDGFLVTTRVLDPPGADEAAEWIVVDPDAPSATALSEDPILGVRDVQVGSSGARFALAGREADPATALFMTAGNPSGSVLYGQPSERARRFAVDAEDDLALGAFDDPEAAADAPELTRVDVPFDTAPGAPLQLDFGIHALAVVPPLGSDTLLRPGDLLVSGLRGDFQHPSFGSRRLLHLDPTTGAYMRVARLDGPLAVESASTLLVGGLAPDGSGLVRRFDLASGRVVPLARDLPPVFDLHGPDLEGRFFLEIASGDSREILRVDPSSGTSTSLFSGPALESFVDRGAYLWVVRYGGLGNFVPPDLFEPLFAILATHPSIEEDLAPVETVAGRPTLPDTFALHGIEVAPNGDRYLHVRYPTGGLTNELIRTPQSPRGALLVALFDDGLAFAAGPSSEVFYAPLSFGSGLGGVFRRFDASPPELFPLADPLTSEDRLFEPRLVTVPGDSPDTDGDGVADLYDLCRLVNDPGQADADRDGVGDACDNCPTTPNVDQADRDKDGVGNACACVTGDTGFVNPTAEEPDTGGKGDGFERAPEAAFSDGGSAARSRNGSGDQHRFAGYDVVLPEECAVRGIEVRLDWRLDRRRGENGLRVELSSDGGASWSEARVDARETTREHTALLGGPLDSWGRPWGAGQLASDASFLVRVTAMGTRARRDYVLDWVPVRVFYGP